MTRLGLDLGSTAIKAVLLDERDQVIWQGLSPCEGAPDQALLTLLDEIVSFPKTGFQKIKGIPTAVVGRLRGILTRRDETTPVVSDVAALARGAQQVRGDVSDVVAMGGHDTMWCRLYPGRLGVWDDFAISDLCAAGAGSFFAQQAERLGYTPSGLGEVAAAAKHAPTVAGRCAVFTKSDIIHLQQKGTPVDEIALGLSFALVRTFQSQVLHGRRLATPVMLAGGCARNAGIVRAFIETFHLSPDAVVVHPDPEMIPALGAALLAEKQMTLSRLIAVLKTPLSPDRGGMSPLPRVTDVGLVEPTGITENTTAVLGVDVGSVSTNLVLVDEAGRLLSSAYVKTSGRPVEALKTGLAQISSDLERCRIVGVATTGSGRHLAGHLLGGDWVKNEISAQLRAAAECRPDVDTVLEIGGQDAKYIHADKGRIVDFAMNRVCAAGTGSFLEEQAGRLDVNIIDEFAKLALTSKSPADLGRRCTVFMESEMVSAFSAGAALSDVTAGLAYSVARNYLERVVAGRPIGDVVVFQGGCAANRAVVAAFASLLGKEVTVHPFARISGAFGVALLLLDERRAGRITQKSRYRGDTACDGVMEQSFECTHCNAHCQVIRFRSKDGVFHFGDVCERYSAKDGKTRITDPLARRFELLLDAADVTTDVSPSPQRIGLLRTSHTMMLLPFFAALTKAMGREPYLASPTSSKTMALAASELSSDTCMPVKAAYGQAMALKDTDVEQLLIPAISALPGPERLAHSCLFSHHLPFMMKELAGDKSILAPPLSLDLPRRKQVHHPKETAAALGLTPKQVNRALDVGAAGYARFRKQMVAWGDEVRKEERKIAVVMGRPYMLSDSYMNMGVGRHLSRLGFSVIPMDALPYESVTLDQRWQDLPWRYTRDLIQAATLIASDPTLHPVVLSSFGCGLDAFALQHLEEIFEGRPYLILEMDEHRSEAGVLTRLEAFYDEVNAHIDAQRDVESPTFLPIPRLTQASRLIMPYFADHVMAHAGLMRAAGFEVVVLPPPNGTIREKGEAFTSGRECHPFAMVAGDLIHWLESGESKPNDVYFYPGTVVSCLLRQYGDGLNHMLHRMGADRIRIVTPALDSWIPLVGLSLTIRMQAVQVASDALIRAQCRIRPYEKNSGETDAVYQECLARLSKAAEKGTHFETLVKCVDKLARIPTGGETRPIVGVAGDLYTRINDFASDGLFYKLEAAGMEVWPSPYGTDIAELNAARRRAESFELYRYRAGMRYTMAGHVMRKQTLKIEKIFSQIAGMRPEPDALTYEALASPYLGVEANPLMVQNIGRMLVYAHGGASGILNASCINCMVGAASEAFESRLKRDLGHIPTATLVYGGSDSSVNQARLEAFVHQVLVYAKDKNSSPPTNANTP